MEFMLPLISTCICAMCENPGSCAKDPVSLAPVCRGCDPENWQRAADAEKDMYLSGVNLQKLEAAK